MHFDYIPQGVCASKISFDLNDGIISNFAIGGGVLHIEKNSKVTLLLDSIEAKDEIDIERAEKAKERAEDYLTRKDNVDISRAKLALNRALNRINVFNEK